MRKSIFTFGLIISMTVANVANANVTPTKEIAKKIETTSIKNVAPLSIAVAKNDVATVKKFIEFGSNLEVKSVANGMTPLMYAARYNNVELLKVLIANGADDKAKSKIGYTALDYAKLSGANDATAYLSM
ncbi:ankyrin repeat domain-containing protein [Cellulophaga baltica]|uniref:ankyrin repeat domain-containing protein n=1 Tax=Cellulophaga TaxID=104264 RepID=UPI001C076F8D|nr:MULTISPECIES: ankyrin repeat domain-containing protein [Cellulophaga]MBU2997124.1 ankyrin repeat domain-containing protein [Cellulophaga baltica]MDO6768522.1 ankyrin repeat domain-containing protein [Cellulophaga sp. 1_MG-2023]